MAVNDPRDIVILSNGPGELSTWVQPVVKELRRQLGDDRSQVRISVVLSPCANASGQEAAIARRFSEVDRIQGADHFFRFLLTGKTYANWDWHDRGVVIFLGGDQFFPIVIGKRLGYSTVIYAEWQARWHRWGDRFGVMNAQVLDRIPAQYVDKFAVVGDLMAEAAGVAQDRNSLSAPPRCLPAPFPALCSTPLIGLLPGSKPMKLMLGVPLTLAIANATQRLRSSVQFVIPVSPTLDLPTLARYANPEQNPVIKRLGWASGTLEVPSDPAALPYLQTTAGVKVFLWTDFPAYDLLTQCELCVTTLGANTAELGALSIPMLVLLPTQQLHVMRAWDGIPGLLVNLPVVGAGLATFINWFVLQNIGLRAWPNIWARREIVPELVGRLEPDAIAQQVLHYLDHPSLLEKMRCELRQVRGAPGAAEKLVQLVKDVI